MCKEDFLNMFARCLEEKDIKVHTDLETGESTIIVKMSNGELVESFNILKYNIDK